MDVLGSYIGSHDRMRPGQLTERDAAMLIVPVAKPDSSCKPSSGCLRK
jgi:hypothetical protein